MLRLLLDEHLSLEIAKGLRRRKSNLTIHGLAEWEGGRLLGMSDEVILQEAARQKLTLVTYDLKTIPPLLKTWIESGRDHAGVIFVDAKTVPPSDFGGLIRALDRLSEETHETSWTNAVWFLRR